MKKISDFLFSDLKLRSIKTYQAIGGTLLAIALPVIITILLVNTSNKRQAALTIKEQCKVQATDYLNQANAYLTSGTTITLSTFFIQQHCPEVYATFKSTEDLVYKKVQKEFDYEAKRKVMALEIEERKQLESKLFADLTKAISVLQRVPNAH